MILKAALKLLLTVLVLCGECSNGAFQLALEVINLCSLGGYHKLLRLALFGTLALLFKFVHPTR